MAKTPVTPELANMLKHVLSEMAVAEGLYIRKSE